MRWELEDMLKLWIVKQVTHLGDLIDVDFDVFAFEQFSGWRLFAFKEPFRHGDILDNWKMGKRKIGRQKKCFVKNSTPKCNDQSPGECSPYCSNKFYYAIGIRMKKMCAKNAENWNI